MSLDFRYKSTRHIRYDLPQQVAINAAHLAMLINDPARPKTGFVETLASKAKAHSDKFLHKSTSSFPNKDYVKHTKKSWSDYGYYSKESSAPRTVIAAYLGLCYFVPLYKNKREYPIDVTMLADYLGMSWHSLHNAVKKLEGLGLITVQREHTWNDNGHINYVVRINTNHDKKGGFVWINSSTFIELISLRDVLNLRLALALILGFNDAYYRGTIKYEDNNITKPYFITDFLNHIHINRADRKNVVNIIKKVLPAVTDIVIGGVRNPFKSVKVCISNPVSILRDGYDCVEDESVLEWLNNPTGSEYDYSYLLDSETLNTLNNIHGYETYFTTLFGNEDENVLPVISFHGNFNSLADRYGVRAAVNAIINFIHNVQSLAINIRMYHNRNWRKNKKKFIYSDEEYEKAVSKLSPILHSLGHDNYKPSIAF